jgi:hypothetical protein
MDPDGIDSRDGQQNEIIGSGSLVGLLHTLASRSGDHPPASGAIGSSAEPADVEAST